ncbi:toxin-antitoxin system HicB family antitoxin [Paenibacillus sp. ACRRX]|uniref:ribbon-helix-helix domain-containing protein n=1 Tax=unclassified Paenibacillus TaxID=185978 RepID=UPI001EF50088|nr:MULTISPECIES: toxin-antitoxin system HicB family antitoxin [unclassified Paenibacillus]MCG7408217.1 toxin-antitoxin system HicB family antitoxin [Paenibacillus sp. ACRRX]MDK8181398.1 toxin-antitoxin system HicB family antitoxin [Paenibacillus sp. UMB4589-SE434]
MASKKKSFPLRLDPSVYEALERWASDEFRSVNGHMEFLLREALREAGRLPSIRRQTSPEPVSEPIHPQVDPSIEG